MLACLATLGYVHGVAHLNGGAGALRTSAPAIMLAARKESEDERQEKMRQLFGAGFKTDEDKELSRVTRVEQPEPAQQEAPEWMQRPVPVPADWRTQRFGLWLEDSGVDMQNVLLVPGAQMRLVTAKDVRAGDVLFDVPSSLLLTASDAFADPDVGRELRSMAAKGQAGAAGFDTFAIATLLAAERVRRGVVRGRLRRQDDGVLGGGDVLPAWQVEDIASQQVNTRFGPFVETLDWPAEEDECLVEVERAEAVRQGSALIARLVEPCARNAWMAATQRVGLVQSTSEEDCECSAMQALVLAIEAQLEPPPPLGEPGGEAFWGGTGGPAATGPALCPLVNLVLPPKDAAAAAAAAAAGGGGAKGGVFNAQLGRPRTGSVESAIRCVALVDLAAGTPLLSDVPGATASAAAGDRVVLVEGALRGRMGRVVSVRAADGKPIVRLDGATKLVVVEPARLSKVAADAQPGGPPQPSKPRGRTQIV